MPICPRCSATIHAGANAQCPACSYSLLCANEMFGDGEVEFTRVVDSAGALTHQERQELLHFLENLERDIPPVALCIYITDDGLADDFRTHAHWILNHARIHHPSFGRREKHMAIEDAELRVRQPGEARVAYTPEPVQQHGWLSRLRTYLRDALHPSLPPPVRHQWMLILVLDVQLERACFSWGYQLDPYVNPDSINRCIVGAKFQFRERAMVAGLRKVMRAAVTEIASGSRRVNAQLRRSGRALGLAATLAASLLLGSLPCEAAPAAASAAAVPALADDDVAEEVATTPPSAQSPAPVEADSAGDAAAPTPASETPAAASAPPPEPGAPATYAAPPRWHDEDYRHLMAGELAEGYSMLVPPAAAKRAEARFRPSPGAKSEESDKKVLGRYMEGYKFASPAGLCDPQSLLTVEERRDVEHVLRELNADGRFRIYVTLLRDGQQIPPELSAQTLAKATAPPCEYAALVLFPLGNSQALDLGYAEMKPTDEERHAWLSRVRASSAREGHGVEALLLAIREVHAIIDPLSVNFRPLTAEKASKAPLIVVEYRPDTREKKLPFKVKMANFFKEVSWAYPALFAAIGFVLFLGALVLVLLYRRRSGHLIMSREDTRLSSPYGAGVSRFVRYLEGKESPKENRIF